MSNSSTNDYIVMQELPSGKTRIAEGNGSGTHPLQDALTLLASLRFNFPTTQFFVVRVVVVEDVPAVLDDSPRSCFAPADNYAHAQAKYGDAVADPCRHCGDDFTSHVNGVCQNKAARR